MLKFIRRQAVLNWLMKSMLEIGDTVVSFDLFEHKFCCDLSVCRGCCCVEGDAGAPLTEEEVRAQISDIIAQTGASTMKDMGKVMGLASKQMAGQADGKTISTIVRQLLA